MPVLTLGQDVGVCSMTVKSPRRGFRPEKTWLVTLNNSQDGVVIRRSYG
jgi:hypothetical protein